MRKLSAIILLSIALPLWGVNRVRFVDTGANAGGNGTTAALSSGDGSHAYDDLAEAILDEVAADADLSDEGDLYFYCARSGAGGVDSSSPDVTGFTMGAYRVYIIGTDFPATGVYDSTQYVLTNANALKINQSNTTVQCIQVAQAGSSGSRYGIRVGGSTDPTGIVIDRCIVRGAFTGETGLSHGIRVADAGDEATVVNTTITGYVNGANTDYIAISAGGPVELYVYNCTIVGNYYGVLESSTPTFVVKNCYFGNVDDFSGDSFTLDYIVSNEDVSKLCANYWAAPTAGVGDYSLDLTNAAGGNFTLLATAKNALHTGLAQPSGAATYNYDLVNRTRPQGAGWDIGAYELQVLLGGHYYQGNQ